MTVLSPAPVVMPIAAVYGAVIGSFLANAAVRLPEQRSLLTPSSCPRCGARVRWSDNVPVLSWLRLRGRCRDCGQPITPLYPLVEALTAILAALLARHLFHSWSDLDLAHVVAWVYQLGFVSLLVLLATVDVRHRIVPDETSIYAVPFGVAGHAVLQIVGFDGWWHVPADLLPLQAPTWLIPSLLAAGTAGVFYGLFWFTGALSDLFVRADSLGWGDIKLAAMLGAFLGPVQGIYTLLLASLIASVVGIAFRVVLWRTVWLPFGPAAALAALFVVLFGDVDLLTLIARAG